MKKKVEWDQIGPDGQAQHVVIPLPLQRQLLGKSFTVKKSRYAFLCKCKSYYQPGMLEDKLAGLVGYASDKSFLKAYHRHGIKNWAELKALLGNPLPGVDFGHIDFSQMKDITEEVDRHPKDCTCHHHRSKT